ncbi:unnamed protein product [Tenebrio molitor]|nr:unnamed protein product [Tenebrio molitor]
MPPNVRKIPTCVIHSFTESAALLRPSTRRHLLPKGALRAAGRPLARNSPDRGLLLVENNPTVGSPPRKTGQLPQEGVKREQV